MNDTLEWNASHLLESIGGDMDLFKTILDAYLTDTPKLIDELIANFEGKNSEKAIRNAHSIKGASGSIGAKTIYDLASACEKNLTEKPPKATQDQIIELKTQLQSQFKIIRDYVNSH